MVSFATDSDYILFTPGRRNSWRQRPRARGRAKTTRTMTMGRWSMQYSKHVYCEGDPELEVRWSTFPFNPSLLSLCSLRCILDFERFTALSAAIAVPDVQLGVSATLSHKSSFVPRTCNSWNVLPSSCFPESYNLPSFKSKINKLDLVSLSS